MNRLILLFLLFSLRAFPQTADGIINKYIEATGGKEKWLKVTTLQFTGDYVMGPGVLAPVRRIVVSQPFKGIYNDFTWQGMTSKHAMRGDSGWTYNPFGGKRETDPMSPNTIRETKLTADPQGLLVNYKEKGYTVDYLGTDDMDGTDVYKLRLTNKDGDMVYYFIDVQTSYILKMETRVKLKDKEEKAYYSYSDFRKTSYGITVPFSTQGVDENGNEQGGPVIFNKVEVDAPVDLTVFDKPKSN